MASFKHTPFAALVTLPWFFGVSACSSSNNNQTPPVYGSEGGGDATSPSEAGSDDSTQPDTGTDSTVAADDASDATQNDVAEGSAPEASSGDGGNANADAGTDGAEAAAPCTSALGDAGCWTCPSASQGSLEFLNQCSANGVKCVHFENASRLPSSYDGGLPPLN